MSQEEEDDGQQRKQGKSCDNAVDCLGEGTDCLGGDCVPGCDACLFSVGPLVLGSVVIGAFRASAVDPHTVPRSSAATGASRLVRSYQVNVSAKRARPVCNLSPSCSRYGLQALADRGLLRGCSAIGRRLLACREAGQAASVRAGQ